MRNKRLIIRCALLFAGLIFPAFCVAQSSDVRSSPAYSEILLRRTELVAELESVVTDYTDAHPRIVDLRYEIASLGRSSEKLLVVKPSDAAKFTLALGKLIVRKAALDMELNRLARSYNKDHPDVRRAKRRVEIFEDAIREILK